MAEVDLIAAIERAMWAGIAAARPGGRLGDVSAAIEQSVAGRPGPDGRRYGSVAGYGGHGIGTAMHMEPVHPEPGQARQGTAAVGRAWRWPSSRCSPWAGRRTRELDDGWTVVTKDGARAAHSEHSIAITEDGISVLTAPDGGAAGLLPFGVVPVSLD